MSHLCLQFKKLPDLICSIYVVANVFRCAKKVAQSSIKCESVSKDRFSFKNDFKLPCCYICGWCDSCFRTQNTTHSTGDKIRRISWSHNHDLCRRANFWITYSSLIFSIKKCESAIVSPTCKCFFFVIWSAWRITFLKYILKKKYLQAEMFFKWLFISAHKRFNFNNGSV